MIRDGGLAGDDLSSETLVYRSVSTPRAVAVPKNRTGRAD